MKDEIKVGEWIRTYNGEIGKIIKIKDEDEYSYDYYICDDDRATSFRSMIVNHSKNIIDLIEVGDYVNGNIVLDKYLFNGELPVLETTGKDVNDKCLANGDIKTIVTKEQFKAMEYKI